MAQNALQSTNIAGSGTNVDTGDDAWTNPGNITADDGSGATWGTGLGGASTDILRATSFGFNLPGNASVDGVVVTFGGSTSDAYAVDVILRTDALTGEDKGGPDPLAASYGSSTDLWGLALTPSIVNGSDFGVDLRVSDISGGGGTADVDYVQITVYWHFDLNAAPAEVALHQDYKIYDATGSFLGLLPNVVSEFKTVEDINSAGSQLDIEVAGTPDDANPPLALGTITQWLQGGWAYRQKITIPKETVSGELSEFPVYLNLADLGSLFFGDVDTAGADIRITNRYGINELPFELMAIDTANKTGRLWFRADLLSSTEDTIFYIYYGNSDANAYAASDAYGSQNVWHDYELVSHDGGGTDSTANGFNGTAQGGVVPGGATGKIGTGTDFDGVDDYITTGYAPDSSASDATFGVWVNMDDLTDNMFIEQDDGGSPGGRDILRYRNSNSSFMFNYSGANLYSIATAATGQWYHVAGTWDVNTGTATLYINGLQDNQVSGVAVEGSSTALRLGAAISNSLFLDGILDEVRMSLTVRSAAYIAAEYSNQSDPANFYQVGSRELEGMAAHTALIKNGNLVHAYETSYYYPNGKLLYRGQINKVEAEFAASVDGTIKAKCHSDGRDLDNMIARGAPFSYTNDQSQTITDATHTVSDIGGRQLGWERCGQSWTVGAGVSNLGRLQLKLQGAAAVTVSVYTNPQLTTLLGSVTRSVNTSGADVVDFIFGNFIDVTPGSQYFFTVAVGDGQSIDVHYKNDTDPYSNGSMYTASFNGTLSTGDYFESAGDDLYFTAASATPSTQATYTNADPTADMLTAILDDYILRGGNVSYDADSIDATGRSLELELNTNTVYEAIEKILDMAPNGFYFSVDLGSNLLSFREVNAEPDFLLVKGRHVESLKLEFSIEDVINTLLFTGGDVSGSNLYSKYTSAASDGLYGKRLDRKTDNRVTNQATADAIGRSKLAKHDGEQYYTSASVLARTMDITQLKPGKTVGFRGYGSFVDALVLQITRLDYTATHAKLQLGTLPPRFNTQLEKTVREVLAIQTIHNPSQPS